MSSSQLTFIFFRRVETTSQVCFPCHIHRLSTVFWTPKRKRGLRDVYSYLHSFTIIYHYVWSYWIYDNGDSAVPEPDDPRWSLRTRITTDDIGDHFFVHVPNLGGKNIPLIFTIMNICIYICSSKHLNAINYTSNNIPWWWFELFVFFQCWLDDDDPNPNWLSIFVQGVAKKQQQ